MIILFILSQLISTILGFLIICLVSGPISSSRDFLSLKLFLSAGLGMGLSSCLFFFYILLLGSSGSGYVLAEIVIIVGLLMFSIHRTKTVVHDKQLLEAQTITKPPVALIAAFALALGLSLFHFVLVSTREPHGTIMDAWAIWNLRARFIFQGGSYWKETFNSLLIYSQIDYPLLISLSVARSWLYAGREISLAPIVIAGLFTFMTVGLVYSALSILRNTHQGLLAGTVMLGASYFVTHGASQLADIPFGFFMLATFVLFFIEERSGNRSFGFLILAGMTAGCAAWTKNEGLLFLLIIPVIRFVAVVPAQGLKSYIKQMFSFSLGLLPLLIAVIILKLYLAPPNGLIHPELNAYSSINLSESKISKLLDFSRYYLTLRYFVGHTLAATGWMFNPFYLFAMYPLCVGVRIRRENRAGLITIAMGLSLILTGYFFIYIITPYPLIWHLENSYNRLILQLWPSALFLYFMVVRCPASFRRRFDRTAPI